MNDPGHKDHERYTTRKSLVIDLTAHVVLTSALSCFFYFSTGRLSQAVLCILGGVFIDTDHFIDHFLHHGWRFGLKDFLYHSHLDSGKVYIVFHSWELIILLWGVSFMVSLLLPLAAGMTLHLAVDQVSCTRSKLFYFLAYRWYHGFRWETAAPDLLLREKKEHGERDGG